MKTEIIGPHMDYEYDPQTYSLTGRGGFISDDWRLSKKCTLPADCKS